MRPGGGGFARGTWAPGRRIKYLAGTLVVGGPRAWLRRNRAGLWYSVRDIPPGRIRRVLSFAELAGTSAA
jgi:hypothetical protein